MAFVATIGGRECNVPLALLVDGAAAAYTRNELFQGGLCRRLRPVWRCFGAVGMADHQRVEAWYWGHVQGVGFRQRTRSLAADFAVVGEVRNLSDGRVELLAEGQRSELDGFLRAVDDALGGFIRGKRIEWTTADGRFTDFHVAQDRLVD